MLESPAQPLFASVLPKGESAQSQGLRWAGVALLATAAVSGTRLIVAPHLAGTGIYWWIAGLIAVMDILLGISLVVRSERFVLVVMVWSVAAMLFDVVVGLRGDSAAFIAEGVCFNGGILLLLAGYPRTWRLASGLAVVAGTLALQLYAIGGVVWQQVRRISADIQAVQHVRPLPGPEIHSARFGYRLRADPQSWSIRDLSALSPAERGQLDLWLVHRGTGAQLAVRAVRRERLAEQPLDELRAELLGGFPAPLAELAAKGEQWFGRRSTMALRRNAAEQWEAKSLGRRGFAHLGLHVDGDVGLGVVAFVPRETLDHGNPALVAVLDTLRIDPPGGEHLDAATVDSIGRSLDGSLARLGSSGKTASGVVVSSDASSALVLTTADFLGGARHVDVIYNNGFRSAAVGARVVWADPKRNLALVSFPASRQLPPMAFSSAPPQPTAPLALLGFPANAKPVPVPVAVEVALLPPARAGDPPSLSGVPDSKGLSGGPVVDRDGNVLGIAVLRAGQPATLVGADVVSGFLAEVNELSAR